MNFFSENKSRPSGQSILKIIAGYAFIYAVLEILAALTGDPLNTVNAAVISAGVIAAVIIAQTVLFKNGFSNMKEYLGIGTPSAVSILISIVISILLFLCYPLITYITGYRFRLPDNWLWLGAGVFLLHGIAEEVLYRSYLFRYLRNGRSFNRAVWISVLLFSTAHIPVIISQGIFVGGSAVMLAAVSSFPLSKLYEKGNNTIWAPAIVHTAIDTIIPLIATDKGDQSYQTAVVIWMVASMIIPYGVFPVKDPGIKKS
ncbi:MAG TPA: CPBP family intramembrane metalloprotease [Ignavibacteria bacterium]|nr:CPBP family intramembrane metalloprotease [Ignavibacteria bacterium]HMR41959.1 CPBP family intramembrane metalloprotease [Ignavibacteria bacterium]